MKAMHITMTRRSVAAGLSAAIAMACAGPASAAANAFAAIEARVRGRLGVFARDTGSGRSVAWRADERFLMCSTFKTLAVASVLARVDRGRERLGRRIAYGQADLLDYAPVTRAHVAEGAMSVEALCAAAIEMSDNTAANLLLATVGGPAGVTRYARGIGDSVTRLDRNEPVANHPDGILDTTSPRAMAGSVQTILLGHALAPPSRKRLEDWMAASTPGAARLRAGLPAGWRVGHKAGTGNTETNDVAIIRPPGRAPVIVAAYLEAAAGNAADAVLRDVGAIITKWVV
jgi:beta-lactamase class A